MPGNFLPLKSTLEMDGIFTQEDADNRFFVMAMCAECSKWTKMDIRTNGFKCAYCQNDKHNLKETRSIRSWLVTKDVKVRKTRNKLDTNA